MSAYRMNIAGLDRDLPLCPLNDKLQIAAFVIFGDPELTTACARALLDRAPAYDYLITAEAEIMRGKRILIEDDDISTGESLHAVEELVKEAGGIICGRMAILAEGEAQERPDLIYLEKLPLFNPDGTIMG